MTDIQNSLELFWRLLAIPLLFCCLLPLFIIVHHVTTDPVARALAPPGLWPFMAIYDLIRLSWSSRKIIVFIECEDPIVIKRITPDMPLDGAEDPI